ncbi:GAF domain-containing protein [Pseudoduganella aquatica]|uniref:GAF domain-containing protein n=1 Tax=Pseudoduganella aquatica TaxID=2660641 RepID=UPI001E380FFF|nr:GAF domain-containing protein [Pseudoduganella aquatica]
MLAAPTPPNEAERIAALYALLILDTPREERFDKIVEFAASEFDVPIALISLLDSDRQWFKSCVGLDACETGRDISFCGHAIMRAEIMEVRDAAQDPRFADNPLVTGPPHIRFYAGAPLLLPNGYALGTICLIDTKPRQLDDVEMAILSTLRGLVMQELQSQQEASHA